MPRPTPSAPAREIMTTGEVAEWLHVHPMTLYRLAHGHKIPGAFKVGGEWRFQREAIEQWCKQKEGS
jgi:excisionase family DNA binding protein